MLTLYIDADACPVKDEIYKVTERFAMPVIVVANSPMRIPRSDRISLVEKKGFDGVDDWIAEQCGPGDIVITADIPLAARSLAKGAKVLDPRGVPFTENDIGVALAMRDLMNELRQTGDVTGGPAPMTAKDRSNFLNKLDQVIHAVRRAHPPKK
ncbi:YaiI/YqxD family protein [Zavarzinella formosa]|uniref:YaiI/YqxD family protein n=1 Tax=Zavarzinella formosa TaxID=360055 RepID=UPI0002EA947F|nr:YaiI/YqxD family protein [Zavarzinella formosa]